MPPRTAGEADQRQAVVEGAAYQPYRVHDITQFGFRVGHGQRRHVGRRAYRFPEARALAGLEIQAQSHRVRDGQDVREQDGGIQRKAFERLQGDFTGQFRVGAQ
jgi:hypothetical protein